MTAKPAPATQTDFHRALLRWYRTHGRHALPWRTHAIPYTVWVSETMLQQTQVKTVLERFYFPFIQKFPDVQSLAESTQEEILSLWQGLGYYSRARNLHKAAQQASPQLPDTLEGLMALPGIGRNTAHAILALGYGKPYAVMEANVKRVLCRLYGIEHPTDKELWHKAQELLNSKDVFHYNQAMMDFGAMVCTARSPSCGVCPVRTFCVGHQTPQRYPAPKPKKQVPTRHRHIILLQDARGHLYCTPRNSTFLGGLYGFCEQDSSAKSVLHHNVRHRLSSSTHCGNITHTYSHFTLQAQVHVVRVDSIPNEEGWKNLTELNALPMSRADEKALAIALPALMLPASAAPTTISDRRTPQKRVTPASRQAAPEKPAPKKKRPASR